MKKITLFQLWALLSSVLLFSGCEIVGDIFRAGVWVGIILVLLVLVLIVKLIGK